MTEKPTRSLLLATDLTPRCDRAAERAASLAEEWNAQLHVMTVLEGTEATHDQDVSEDGLVARTRRRVEQSLGGRANAVIHVLRGPEDRVITDLAAEVGATLIITGPSGGRWLGQTLLGSTLRSLMRKARVPVLLVKAPVLRKYRRIVVSVDLSDASRAPVEAAFRLFGRGASLSVFHAFRTPYRLLSDNIDAYEAGVREGVTLEIRDALKAWSVSDADDLPVIADHGDAAAKLAEMAERHDIDVVVTGTHGRTGLMSLMLGSVAEAIVEAVACDVLVAPSRGAWPD
jgi:nucleotide-binding universal stress UspA family protein